MAAKRKTLPKDIHEIIARFDASGDDSELAAVFAKCDINAYDRGRSDDPVLFFFGVSEQVVRWMVQHGADLEYRDRYGETALISHAGSWKQQLEVLLELGANLDAYDDRGLHAMHHAARAPHPGNLRILLAAGADANVKTKAGRTVLETAVAEARNDDTVALLEATGVLLEAGAAITGYARQQLERVGRDFERFREVFNEEAVDEYSAALDELYRIYEVPPVPRKEKKQAPARISVPEGSWSDAFDQLWEQLVPAMGTAETLQGEAIRITGRVADEIYRNGAANWDRKMISFLPKILASGSPLDDELVAEAKTLAKGIHEAEFDELNRLCELAVQWVAQNPEPIAAGEPSYRR